MMSLYSAIVWHFFDHFKPVIANDIISNFTIALS